MGDACGAVQYVFDEDKAYRFDGSTCVDLRLPSIKGFSAKNREQRCLLDLLNNDKIGGKVVNGVAGSGKTKCAIKVGLHKVQSGKYNKLVIIRNPVEVGKPIGFLKGTMTDKMEPWAMPIIDNLEGGWQEYERMVSEGQVEFGPIAYIQGRSIDNAFIIVTEAQNMTFDNLVMCGTRVGHNSVIVFDGDEEQVAHEDYKRNNPLRLAPKVFGGNPLFGYMRMTETVRSDIAKMFAAGKAP